MLIGESVPPVDTKGRFFVPASFKHDLGVNPVMCPGLEGNLMLYPWEEWQKFVERISEMEYLDAVKMNRYFVNHAVECSIDSQGRMVIPQKLREPALIKESVVVVGSGRYAELWNVEAWADANGKVTEDNIAGLMKESRFKF